MLQIRSASPRADAHQFLSASPRADAHQFLSAPSQAGVFNNRTSSSAVLSTVPAAEWGMATQTRSAGTVSTHRAWLRDHWHLLAQTLRLPDSWQSFLLFTLAVTVSCVGLILHLQLSTTILQDKIELKRLQAEEQVIQEQNANLVWAIVQETDLNQVQARATELGYEIALQRNYVIIAGNTVVDSASQPPSDPALAQVNE